MDPKKIDFKNLSPEQEEKFNKLIAAISASVLSSIEGLSVPPESITIYSHKKLSLAQIKTDAENMEPIWIDHLYMYFSTLETIVRTKSKKKKSILRKSKS